MSAFVEGFQSAQNHWQNRRSDAARAFSEFRSMHPNATYNDYRTMVDQITGGNSFLRGAIPADEILKSLAAENQRKAQQQQMTQRLEMLRSQAQLSGTVGALAQNYAMQYDNDAEVEDALVAALGGDESARNQVRKMYSGGFGPIRQRAQFAAVKDNLPLAVQMLEANPDADLSAFFPDMPKSALSGLTDAAKRRYQESQTTKHRTDLNTLITDGKLAIDMGGTPTYSGYDPEVVELATPRLQAYSDQQAAERAQNEEAKRNEAIAATVEKLRTDVGFMAAAGKNEGSIFNALTTALAGKGITKLSYEDLKPHVEDLMDDSVETKRQLLLQEREAYITDTKARLSTGQEMAVTGLLSLLEKDQALANRAGPYAGAAKVAITQLSGQYDLTSPVAQSAITRLLDSNYLRDHNIDPADPAALAQLILSDPNFAASVNKLSEISAIEDAILENPSGLPDDLMSFDSWATGYRAETQSQIQAISEKVIAPLLSAPVESQSLSANGKIEDAVRRLEMLQDQVAQSAMRFAETSDKWILNHTGAFDEKQAEAIAIERIDAIQTLIDQLHARIRSAEQRTTSMGASQQAAKDVAETATSAPPTSDDSSLLLRDTFSLGTSVDGPPDESWMPEAIPPGSAPTALRGIPAAEPRFFDDWPKPYMGP